VTGNLILVSRSAVGNGIRVLNGLTGADIGSLAQGSGIITGGTFTTNMVGVAADGNIFVGNLQGNVGTSAFKLYQWASEGAAAPTVYFNSTVPGFVGTSPRLGDSLDVIGSGAGTTIVAGGSGTTGYAIFNGGAATAVPSFTPVGPAVGDFRLGVTFTTDANNIWGKQTSNPLRRTSYLAAAGATLGANTLTTNGEAAMDFMTFGGIDYLATLDMNSSIVRIYDVTNPTTFRLITSATTTSGTLTANGNATGSIKFGADNGDGTINLYAMSTNQGIEAFLLNISGATVPEPGTLALFGMGTVGMGFLRRRKK
jgi:hypothetical protein